jgi:spore coat polysaccharide biosynthesis predicted glycosyltransferase SpsG
MKIAIYCTGGTKLGYGHLQRSKVFARSAPNGINVLVVPVIDDSDAHYFSDMRHISRVCNTDDQALAEIAGFNPEIVVFDTVECSDRLFDAVSKGRRTISISPVFSHMSRVNYLFTRNKNTPPLDNVVAYRGLEYAIFNDTCQVISDEVYYHNLGKPFLTVGIAMGGGDAPNRTLDVLRSVCQLEVPCSFWILIGEGYRHSYHDLVSSITRESSHELILAKTNRSMWQVLANCTVAVLAGGITTLEAVYAGLPTLNLFSSPGQLAATGTELFDTGAAETVGSFGTESLTKLRERIAYYNSNRSQLLLMRERTKGKIDKLGARRIMDRIAELGT